MSGSPSPTVAPPWKRRISLLAAAALALGVGVVASGAPALAAEQTYTHATGATITYDNEVVAGEPIALSGTNWLAKEGYSGDNDPNDFLGQGDEGSIIGVKFFGPDGTIVRNPKPVNPYTGDAGYSSPDVWEIIQAAGSAEWYDGATPGSWAVELPWPSAANGATTPVELEPGDTFSLQLLTGTLFGGDLVGIDPNTRPDVSRTINLTFTVVTDEPAGTAPTIADTPAPADGTVGVAYEAFTVPATGDPTPDAFAITSGALPAGLELDATTGVISGTPSAAGSSTFTVRAANGVDPAATREYTITVVEAASPLAVATQPQPVAVANGAEASFTAAASGGAQPVTVQWQRSTSASASTAPASYVNLTAANTLDGSFAARTLRFTAGSNTNTTNRWYRAVFTDADGATVTTAPARLSIVAVPTVTQHPTGQTIAEGGTATFTAAGSSTVDLTVTWQSTSTALANGEPDASTWTAVAGAEGDTLTVAGTDAATQDGTFYRAVLTNVSGSAYSQPAQLRFYEQLDTTASVTVTGTTYGPAGTTPKEFSVSAPNAVVQGEDIVIEGFDYLAVDGVTGSVSNALVDAEFSGDPRTLSTTRTVYNPQTGGTYSDKRGHNVVQAGGAGENAGGQTIVAQDGTAQLVHYPEWEPGYFRVVIPWPDETNTTQTAEFFAENWKVGTQHTVRFLTGSLFTPAGGDYQGGISVRFTIVDEPTGPVAVAPVVTTQPTARTVVAGESVSFTAAATGDPEPTVRWESSTDGTTWAPVAGATSATLSLSSTTTAQSGTRYRAVFTNGAGSATSDAATLTVRPVASVTVEQTAELGGTIHVTGEGFFHPSSTEQGSRIGIKIDEGAYSHLDASVHANRTIWAVVDADVDGTFAIDLQLPDGTTEGGNGSTPAFTTGTHSLRLLTGSLLAGDTSRTVRSADFTVTAPSDLVETTAPAGGTLITPRTVVIGEPITISGKDFFLSDGSGGSGGPVFINQPSGGTGPVNVANRTIENQIPGSSYADARAHGVFHSDDEGNWTLTIPFPTPENSTLTEETAWQVGQIQSIRILTGSLVADDRVRSLAAEFTIVGEDGPAPVAPMVTAQPSDVSVEAGADASFTAAASGTPTPSVQWESSVDGATWAPVAGATDATLTLSGVGVGQDGTQLRAVFTNSAGTVTTDPATLTVTEAVEPIEHTGVEHTTTDGATYYVPAEVEIGQPIRLSGSGWTTQDGAAGSRIAVKFDRGATGPLPPVYADGTVYAIVDANANGEWVVEIPFPTPDNSSASGEKEWAIGQTHVVNLLSGSLREGDTPRSGSAGSFVVTGDVAPAGQVAVTATEVEQYGDVWFDLSGFVPGTAVSVELADAAGAAVVSRPFTIGDDGNTANPDGQTYRKVTVPRDAATGLYVVRVRDTASGDVVATSEPVTVVAATTRVFNPGDHAGGEEDMLVQRGGTWTFHAVGFAPDGRLTATAEVGGETVVLSGLGQVSASELAWQLDANGDTEREPVFTRVQIPANVPPGPFEVTFGDGSTTVTRTVVVEAPTQAAVTVGETAELGGTIRVTGEGFVHPNGEEGSTIAIKINDGAYSRLDGSTHANRTIWWIVEADEHGDFAIDLPLPNGTEADWDDSYGSVPAATPGQYTLRFLTGSLKPGDQSRTLQSAAFTVTDEGGEVPTNPKPVGVPNPPGDWELVEGNTGGASVVQEGVDQIVTLPDVPVGTWVYPILFLESDSPFEPGETMVSNRFLGDWFQVDENHRVRTSWSALTFNDASPVSMVFMTGVMRESEIAAWVPVEPVLTRAERGQVDREAGLGVRLVPAERRRGRVAVDEEPLARLGPRHRDERRRPVLDDDHPALEVRRQVVAVLDGRLGRAVGLRVLDGSRAHRERRGVRRRRAGGVREHRAVPRAVLRKRRRRHRERRAGGAGHGGPGGAVGRRLPLHGRLGGAGGGRGERRVLPLLDGHVRWVPRHGRRDPGLLRCRDGDGLARDHGRGVPVRPDGRHVDPRLLPDLVDRRRERPAQAAGLLAVDVPAVEHPGDLGVPRAREVDGELLAGDPRPGDRHRA
ncbi:MAG: putative Ig domain-containing protein, partial [Salana multivorans]|nr:putative Ig domain-containing protein [Salana multivorans]